jgi:hypothetical protein
MRVRFIGVVVLKLLFLINSICFLNYSVFLAGQEIVTKTENGIQVIYNPKNPVPPEGSPSSIVLKLDLVIGSQAENEEYMFYDLRSVQVDDQENIYALDWKEIKIKVFDKNGKPLRSFGQRGQGPGEMSMPTRMVISPGNNLIIDDMGNSKLIFYSLDGRFIKEIPMGKYWSAFSFTFDSKGNIYAYTRSYGETMISELKKFDSDLKPVATIASFEERRSPSEQAFTARISHNVTRDDNIIWLITSKYELTVVNSEGRTIKRILKDYDPVKITKKIKDDLIKEEFGDRGIPPGMTFEVPSHFPPTRYFIVDEKGRMIVSTYEYEDKDGIQYLFYDVFDSEGRYIAKFSHPKDEIVFVVKKNKVYSLVRESEEGIPLVKRHSMVWK